MQQAKSVFGPHALSVEEIQRWLRVNPYAIGVLTRKERFCGYIDILPLTPTGLAEVRNPTLSEKEWDTSQIQSPGGMRSATDLYLASLLAVNRQSPDTHTTSRALFVALAGYLETLYGSGTKQCWGLAATEDGRRVMSRWGASLVEKGEARADGMALYRFALAPDKIRDIVSAHGRSLPEVAIMIDRPRGNDIFV